MNRVYDFGKRFILNDDVVDSLGVFYDMDGAEDNYIQVLQDSDVTSKSSRVIVIITRSCQPVYITTFVGEDEISTIEETVRKLVARFFPE